MTQDGVNADAVPVPIDRYHGRGPQRGGRRRVIAATYLRGQRERERETLQLQLDLAYAHTELNGINCRTRNKNGTLLQRISWRKTCGYSRLRLGMPPLGAASNMVMETTMTRGLRYISFC